MAGLEAGCFQSIPVAKANDSHGPQGSQSEPSRAEAGWVVTSAVAANLSGKPCFLNDVPVPIAFIRRGWICQRLSPDSKR